MKKLEIKIIYRNKLEKNIQIREDIAQGSDLHRGDTGPGPVNERK